MKEENNPKKLWCIAKKICSEYEQLPCISGVVVGGSLARGFTDEYSDIEMYVYHRDRMPSKKEISDILKKLDAPLTRSKNIHWYHPAWGYHTFFGVEGINVELGYRDVENIEKRLMTYMRGDAILSTPGIHDAPFGHYESGIVSCVKESKILSDKQGDIKFLNRLANQYPVILKQAIIGYYMEDAITLTKKKLYYAALRDDSYNFQAVLANIVRSMNLVLFALNETHYPGDKWNEKYIEKFKIKPKNHRRLINELFNKADGPKENKMNKLNAVYNLIEGFQKLVQNKNRK